MALKAIDNVVGLLSHDHCGQTKETLPRLCQPAPSFECDALLSNGEFGKIRLSDYKGKWLVLFFYPLDFTFVCPTEIVAFSDRADDFKKINCEILGASVDSIFSHLAWVETDRKKGGLGRMNIALLGDINHKVSKSYGCLLDGGHTCRSTYIIDPKGVLRHLSFNDPSVGRNVDEVLRLVEAFQFVEQHGEVCPANWKKGSAVIKPDPKGKLTYFEKVEEKQNH